VRKVFVLKECGKKRVKIEDQGYGLEFFTMRNGWQWAGFDVDEELLKMMQDVIAEYFDKTTQLDE